MKKILITGASGFIGSSMVSAALNKGWNVWAGIRESSKTEYLRSSGISFINLRYDNTEILQQQILEFTAEHGKWDYIIHCAGITKSINKDDFKKINFEYTVSLAESLIKINAIPDKFIYMSSFGINSGSAYGYSKKLTENYFLSDYGFPYAIIRPTGVYGPRDIDYLQMIKLLNNRINLSVGMKPQILSFVHVSDLVKLVYTVIGSDKVAGVWQVSDGEVYTTDQFAALISDCLQKKPILNVRIPIIVVWLIAVISDFVAKIVKKPSLINVDKFKIMKIRDWSCDISQLEKDFNFVPDYNLNSGLADTINWYRQNKWLK